MLERGGGDRYDCFKRSVREARRIVQPLHDVTVRRVPRKREPRPSWIIYYSVTAPLDTIIADIVEADLLSE